MKWWCGKIFISIAGTKFFWIPNLLGEVRLESYNERTDGWNPPALDKVSGKHSSVILGHELSSVMLALWSVSRRP